MYKSYLNIYKNTLAYLQRIDAKLYERSEIPENTDEKKFVSKLNENFTDIQKDFINMCCTTHQNVTNATLMCNYYTTSKGDKGILYFAVHSPGKAVSNSEAKKFWSIIALKRDIKHGIFVHGNKLSPQASNLFKENYTSDNIKYKILSENDLSSPVATHRWCPKVVKIHKNGKRYLEENGTTPSLCPKMLSCDPIAKYYDIEPGNVVILCSRMVLPGTMREEEYMVRYVIHGSFK